MNGSIEFQDDVKAMAAFLKEFAGSTAVFKAYNKEFFRGGVNWVVEFNGAF